ncbi:hypothetical protein [Amycolatopsis sp. NPDC004378]
MTRRAKPKKPRPELVKHSLSLEVSLDDLAIVGRDAWELRAEKDHNIPERHRLIRTWLPGDVYHYQWSWLAPKPTEPATATAEEVTA